MTDSIDGRRGPGPIRVSIITPCYNADQYIEETVESVVLQTAVRSGRAELEYLVCDGSSSDSTVDRARAVGRGLVSIDSRRDGGMYDALARGLRAATGDVVAYINAGDYYSTHAFDVMLDVFESTGAQWLTGLTVTYNVRSEVTGAALPFRYRRNLVRGGAYNGRLLPFIQQESTFWRRQLHATLDFERLAKLRLAGDAYMWSRFASVAELYIVDSYLGGFRRHPGQLSENLEAYHQELRSFASPLSFRARLEARADALLWRAPAGLKKRLNPQQLLVYDHQRGAWG